MTWNDFLNWFADSPIAAFLRVFAATVITLAVAEFVQVGQFDLSKWQSWLCRP